jgi:hypothetical protein
MKRKEIKLTEKMAREFAQKALELSVLPMGIQIDILKGTENFLQERINNSKDFSNKRVIRRRDLTRAISQTTEFVAQLEKTLKLAEDAITMLKAELDSCDIGKSPSDKQLIKDEKKRTARLDKFRERLRIKRFVQEGGKS